MAGIGIALLVSWILLWFIAKQNLSVLGFKPNKNRLLHLFIGFLLAAICCTVYHLMKTSFADNHWIVNQKFTINDILKSCGWVIKTVFFEELIFRGALLYLAARSFGSKTACLVSAGSFGIYHWFSYGVIGNPAAMLFIFLLTGILGWVLALAYISTKSLYLPIGVHLGWNLFNIAVFSSGPLGIQLLYKANENKAEGIPSLIIFLFQALALPLVVFLYLKILQRSQNSSVH